MDFNKQMKSPKWQKRRLEILERDKFTCQNCGDKDEQLHVHHYLYKKDKMIWDYGNCHLTTLCEDCHTRWHLLNENIKELLCIDNMRLEETCVILSELDRMDFNGLCDIRRIIKILSNRFEEV